MADSRIDPAPLAASEAAHEIETRILATRGTITPLYRILLHSPPVADGWEHFLTAIRQRLLLPPALRELVILRIAVLNRAPYEFDAHIPFAREAGMSDKKMDAIKTSDFSGFDPIEQLVLEYTDAMTREIHVSDALFDRIKEFFNARGRVELTATIAAYNMVSRFLAALDVH